MPREEFVVTAICRSYERYQRWAMRSNLLWICPPKEYVASACRDAGVEIARVLVALEKG